ncbi:MAG: alpha/beta fold hydrolase [Deltaproteobacteria bacterium]|nr:alpha/beta fold hydrolase [Deltaproteobacteria bacterium]
MADPLHGMTLEAIVTELVDAYGFDKLAVEIPIHCFQNEPSISSSLKFLRRTPWARAKVESFYLFHLREQKRRARREHAVDLRATAGLVVEATKGVTSVVQDVHTAIGAVPFFTDLVYRAIRGVTGVVGFGIDGVVATLAPMLGESSPGDEREAVLAALNGVIGDRLEAAKSPLAIPMSLRPPLQGLHRGGTLLVLVHGSCMNDAQWTRDSHDHGRALARELDVTPAYLHYNSGLHVSENGRQLARLLDQESGAFTDVVVLGHSMGGLVARAALHDAEQAGLPWRRKMRTLITLGTPHHGAPLERGGHALELLLGLTRYSAPLRALGEIRSEGVTDLRYGNLCEQDWQSVDRFAAAGDNRVAIPLPEGVRCCAVAATTAQEGASDEAALPGDGIVPVASALGRHDDPARTLRFAETLVVRGASHLDLLSHPVVFAQLLAWLAPVRPEHQ